MSSRQSSTDGLVQRPLKLPSVDGTSVLTAFVILLIAIPSQLVVPALGGAGTPAQIIGLGALGWWVAERLRQPWPLLTQRQPVRWAMLIFAVAVLASYVAATVRPIQDEELRSSQMGLVSLAAWTGIVFVAVDGIPTRERLHVLLRRLTWAGGAVATLGIVQFLTGEALVDRISIPGLGANSNLIGVSGRSGFDRPAGTAIHAIEFATVLTMVLPLALHFALHDTERTRFRRWYPALAIAVAVPISISRSAIVCSVVVLAFLLPTWTRAARRRAAAVMAMMTFGLYLTVPGLLGTILGLFSGISSDSSAISRTGSYELAWDFIARAPWFGRGFLTFLPGYRILDNQYLGTLIDLGFVGLAALLCLFVVGVISALKIGRRASDTATRHLAQALAAAVASGAVSFGLFDAFSFPMAAGMIFLMLGCVGALNRLVGPLAEPGRSVVERARLLEVDEQRDGRRAGL